MVVLGVNCVSHDSSAAVICGDSVIAAVEEERITRVKHTSAFPEHAIKYCLRKARAERADAIAIPLSVAHSIGRTFERIGPGLPTSTIHMRESLRYYCDLDEKLERLREHCIAGAPWIQTGHHEAHLALAMFSSPFREATLVSLDGSGDGISAAVAAGGNGRIEVLRTIRLPYSVGYFYSAVTEYLGFLPTHDEGKVMALAAYGRPVFAPALANLLSRTATAGPHDPLGWRPLEAGDLELLFGARRGSTDTLRKRFLDLAASAQSVLEDVCTDFLREAQRLTGLPRLCLAGGVALNSVLNGKIARSGLFEEMFVPSAPGDSGTSLGAAMWANAVHGGRSVTYGGSAFLGREFGDDDIARALRQAGIDFVRSENPASKAAALVSRGLVVAWFQGGEEFGPRALGGRSIVADPRIPDMKNRLNAKVKHREKFRPFAPAVIAELSDQYFENCKHTPYMSLVHEVREECRRGIPAAVHHDGTARIQTVNPGDNPLFHELLCEFYRLTGTPMLINTSFNVMGEPMVGTPEDAIRCFFATDIDALVIGRFVVEKVSAKGSMEKVLRSRDGATNGCGT